MTGQTFEAAVIGGGVAGVAAAAELARDASVVLVEREDQPGYHASGRSAALFAPNYGSGPMQELTLQSADFFTAPPEGFGTLLSPRGFVFIAREDQLASLPKSLPQVSGAELEAEVPLIRKGYAAGAAWNEGASDIDVHALMQGYLRLAKARGAVVMTGAEVRGLSPGWQVETSKGSLRARVVVNAAGAWVDEVAKLAGVAPLGFTPMRRSACTVAAPEGLDLGKVPMIVDADEEFYLKPEAGRLMISLADETPSPPCDAQPEELDLAVGVDRAMQACDLQVRRLESRWAGLRTFAPDRAPVVGFDPAAEGFFWMGGQGGTGVQTAPAMGRLVADLVRGDAPEDAALAAEIAPGRFGS